MYEDYPLFLISEIYLQDVGLLSYPHHGPLDRVNWVLPFWVDASSQDVLLGLPLFWGPMDGPANGAYFQTLSVSIQKKNIIVKSNLCIHVTELYFSSVWL